MKFVYSCLILLITLFCVSQVANATKHDKVLSFQPAFPGIVSVFFPVDLDTDDDNIYVTSVLGQIYRFANDDAATDADLEVFFDFTASSHAFFTNAFTTGGDCGLTSFEFHPSYPQVPKFYTFHTSSDTNIQVVAWTVSNGAVDYNSADVLLNIPKHTSKQVGYIQEAYLGGDLRFAHEDGKDNLYISVGYGNDDTSAQDKSNNLGKILRITPRTTSTGYTNPSGNPYINTPGNDEIYARGMRNPRKIYFADGEDDDDSDLYIGDVGATFDEVDRVLNPGQNFGWPNYDGCSGYTSNSPYTFPIYSYTSDSNHAVTMGPYYDGPIKAHRGRMLFADLYSAQVYSVQTKNTPACATVPTPVAVANGALISAFLIVDDVVFVSNVFGAFYGQPNFYKLVEN